MTADALTTSDLVLSQLDAGLALPGHLYTSDELFDQEMAAIFGRQWLYAGHVSQIPESGDYVTVTIGHESGIVVRGQDGAVNGLLNVCRHRGSRLVDCESGSARRFTCPYHQWTYNHDGTLRGAPRMPEVFDKSEFPLKRLHTTVWQGLIFVNFAGDEVEDLHEVFTDTEPLIAPFDIAGARIAHTETYEIAANWKLVWENSQECYHCNANHPEFIRTFDMGSFSQPSLVEAAVCYTEDRKQQSATFPLKEGAESLTMTGSAASSVQLGEFANGRPKYTAANHLKPGFASVFSPDYGITFTDIPVDARHTRVRVQWLVAADAFQDRDYDVENLIHVWHQTNLQDWELCRLVQEGVQSAGFVPGPLSLDETSVAGFYYAYARMLSAAGL